MKGINTRVKNLTSGKRLTYGKLGTRGTSCLRSAPRAGYLNLAIPALARQWNSASAEFLSVVYNAMDHIKMLPLLSLRLGMKLAQAKQLSNRFGRTTARGPGSGGAYPSRTSCRASFPYKPTDPPSHILTAGDITCDER